MIPKETIEDIIQTARVEEVVSEFVVLKKRGANLIGLCPFHNEKTPSFTVSLSKGIYKCFGCGKGGNAVNFIMEHEHYTYPEALRYLAKKYNIAIEEGEFTENTETQNERESHYIVSAYAQKYYTSLLLSHPEGISIGLTYFKERRFSEDIIQKFQLGYSLNEWDAFTQDAIKNGYQAGFLEKTGLSIKSEEKMHDRFRGRVMFPIHSLSGRVIAFGGRILKSNPKSPKYVNSPESEIYHKSSVLYGIFFAKKAIINQDKCYLVEGYTDVISLHQAGIENVVASSGTSLTIEQIRLIGRYTKNITILYDGDPAGIKASLRSIDLVLEEGLNVKIVLFPDKEDPDSFSKKVTPLELKEFLDKSVKDFIAFKTELLLKEVSGDPIKKAELIKDIVSSIAKIPDAIIRSTYTKECSRLMDISEAVLLAELNRIRRQHIKKQIPKEDIPDDLTKIVIQGNGEFPFQDSSEYQEYDIIRLLLNYGNEDINFEDQLNTGEPAINSKVVEFIVHELVADDIVFENEVYEIIFNEFSECYKQKKPNYPGESDFINHADERIRKLTVNILSSLFELHHWYDRHHISVPDEKSMLKQAVLGAIYSLKMKKLEKMERETQQQMKEKKVLSDEELDRLIRQKMSIDTLKREVAKYRGTVIIK